MVAHAPHLTIAPAELDGLEADAIAVCQSHMININSYVFSSSQKLFVPIGVRTVALVQHLIHVLAVVDGQGQPAHNV